MFDKTFVRFAIGFVAIIFFGVGGLYLAGQYHTGNAGVEAAAAK